MSLNAPAVSDAGQIAPEPRDDENRSVVADNEDDRELLQLGYRAVLARGWGSFDNFACSFSALYCIGGIRVLFYIAISGGGALGYLVVFSRSSPPLVSPKPVPATPPPARSTTGHSDRGAGGRIGRFVSFLVAAWTLVAWTAFLASDSFGVANYLVSEVVVFNPDTSFPYDTSDVRARAIAWAISLVFLGIATSLNFLPSRMYSWVFRAGVIVIIIDMLLNFIWLPIGVSQTYGFQSAEYVFTSTYNGGDTAPSLNWALSWYLTASCLVGEDASGHVAEETVSAKKAAAKGVFWATVASAVCGFPIIILFLFCMPSIDVFYDTSAPQPFINMYALALGPRAHVVMTIISMIGAILNTSISLVAASRLVFAVARDGIFPFSHVLARVSKSKQPHNAVIFISTIAALLLCTQLASQVAFSSLISTSAAGSIAAYGLVGLGRTFVTRKSFQPGIWNLGKFGVAAAVITFMWNGFAFSILCAPEYANSEIDKDSSLFNYAIVIMGGVTILALAEWWRKSQDDWFQHLETDSSSQSDGSIKREAKGPISSEQMAV
ncbi:hypothetical protein N7528_006342 [Penicillium herquei]|nr:hypothetical protein N7528_006342 [Penicillium herquei]